MSILKTENLKKYYDTGEVTVKALDGVDLSVEKGEFLSVVGTSGSGKSTLLHMLGGLDIPTSGRVSVGGRDISRMNLPFSEEGISDLSFRITISFP